MTKLEKEVEILRLKDQMGRMAMKNIAGLPYEDQLKAQAEYEIFCKESWDKISELSR